MATKPDWRQASAYDLNQLDRAGLAWEFLRRNPQYRRECEQLTAEASRDVLAAIGEHWGLQFRLRSRPSSDRGKGPVATGASRQQRRPRRGST